jgi:hypothetical protein
MASEEAPRVVVVVIEAVGDLFSLTLKQPLTEIIPMTIRMWIPFMPIKWTF